MSSTVHTFYLIIYTFFFQISAMPGQRVTVKERVNERFESAISMKCEIKDIKLKSTLERGGFNFRCKYKETELLSVSSEN